jgi:hypothetical protein
MAGLLSVTAHRHGLLPCSRAFVAGLGVAYYAAVDAGRGLSLTDAISRVAFG